MIAVDTSALVAILEGENDAAENGSCRYVYNPKFCFGNHECTPGAVEPQPRGTLNIERPTLNFEYLNALHFITEPRDIHTFVA